MQVSHTCVRTLVYGPFPLRPRAQRAHLYIEQLRLEPVLRCGVNVGVISGA